MVSAELTHDVDLFCKMDPYLLIDYNGVQQRTKVCRDGGKTPIWDETFEIPLQSVSDEIQFHIRDDDLIGSELVAVASIKASAFCFNGGTRDYFSVEYEGRPAGKLLLQTHFTPTAPAFVPQPVPQPGFYPPPQQEFVQSLYPGQEEHHGHHHHHHEQVFHPPGNKGIWHGHFSQNGERHEMKFRKLKFDGNRVWGKGKDHVGRFSIQGEFLPHSGDIEFKKEYHE